MQVQIISLEIVPELNSLTNVVCKVCFSLIEDLGILGPSGLPEKLVIGGNCFLDAPNSAEFSSYDSLTESQVIAWVENTKEFLNVKNRFNDELRLFNLSGLQVKQLPW